MPRKSKDGHGRRSRASDRTMRICPSTVLPAAPVSVTMSIVHRRRVSTAGLSPAQTDMWLDPHPHPRCWYVKFNFHQASPTWPVLQSLNTTPVVRLNLAHPYRSSQHVMEAPLRSHVPCSLAPAHPCRLLSRSRPTVKRTRDPDLPLDRDRVCASPLRQSRRAQILFLMTLTITFGAKFRSDKASTTIFRSRPGACTSRVLQNHRQNFTYIRNMADIGHALSPTMLNAGAVVCFHAGLSLNLYGPSPCPWSVIVCKRGSVCCRNR